MRWEDPRDRRREPVRFHWVALVAVAGLGGILVAGSALAPAEHGPGSATTAVVGTAPPAAAVAPPHFGPGGWRRD
jgi:hypothetical protein